MRNKFKLTVRDLDKDHTNEFQNKGAAIANSPKELAQQVDLIITCLPSPKICAEVMEGNDGVITCDVPFMTLAQRVKQMLDCMAVSSAPERSRLVNVFNALLGRSDREGDTRRPFRPAAIASDLPPTSEVARGQP